MPTAGKVYTKSDVDEMFKKIAATLNRRGISRTKMWNIVDGKLNDGKQTNRYKSPYLHFLDDFRKTLTSEQRRDITNVAKMGGAAWHKLTDADKVEYNARAEKSRQEALQKAKDMATVTNNTKEGGTTAKGAKEGADVPKEVESTKAKKEVKQTKESPAEVKTTGGKKSTTEKVSKKGKPVSADRNTHAGKTEVPVAIKA